jgi:DNA-binding NtrC family response regulator
MTALQATRRCLIWLGQCEEATRGTLAAEGWSVREQPHDAAVAIGLRSNDHVALLLDLRDARHGQLAHLVATVQACAHLDRLCLLPGVEKSAAQPWLPVSRHCNRVLQSPLCADALVRCLQELDTTSTSAMSQPLSLLIGHSPVMLATRATVHKFAPVDLPVLLTGQTGTGKELAARALHGLSSRAGAPFVAINCGAIPASLVQAELFGHERGAFTGASSRRAGLFEHAHNGTVFLDEVGDLPADAQTALLRVLQEGTLERIGGHEAVRVDVRVIAATHVDLEQAVADGRFRSDLYYRLNVLRLGMPPLRERGNDIHLLADHALQAFRSHHKARARGFSAAARDAMLRFAWPGNVRELLNRVQRAAILCEQELIEPEDLELARADAGLPGTGLLVDARRHAEREALLACMQANQYNITATARAMHISRVTVYRMCQRHHIVLDSLR